MQDRRRVRLNEKNRQTETKNQPQEREGEREREKTSVIKMRCVTVLRSSAKPDLMVCFLKLSIFPAKILSAFFVGRRFR